MIEILYHVILILRSYSTWCVYVAYILCLSICLAQTGYLHIYLHQQDDRNRRLLNTFTNGETGFRCFESRIWRIQPQPPLNSPSRLHCSSIVPTEAA